MAGAETKTNKCQDLVVCMGEILMELVASPEDRNVGLSSVTQWTAVAGGAPANVAVAIRRLGVLSTTFVGCVGKDPFGTRLRETLQKEGVDTSYLAECDERNDDVHTTLVFTAVHDDGHKELCFYREADRQLLPPEQHSDIAKLFDNYNDMTSDCVVGIPKCLHFGSITFIDEPGATVQCKVIEMARRRGMMVTYDPNYRPTLWPSVPVARRVIFEGFKFAHMAKISQEEFEVCTGHQDLMDGIRAVVNQGVELVIVSRGNCGAIASNGDFWVESPPFEVPHVVETTGAGDAFMAAMITRLLPVFQQQGRSLKNIDRDVVQSALDYANVVGGLTCTKAGAIPALPTAKAVADARKKQEQSPSSFSVSSPQVPRLLITADKLARMIDHTLLKPYIAEQGDVEKLCREADEYNFAMVAVNPALVKQCCNLLRHNPNVRVGAAIGFPLGQTTSSVKAYEIEDAIRNGAEEIDMVLNVRELQGGNIDLVRAEMESMAQICHMSRKKIICKVILETCYLTREEKIRACEICRDAGVDFVKTSTGFGSSGATVEDISLMREVVGNSIGVKASGGIRDLATAEAMLAAGASRLGTSRGVAIIEELLSKERLAGEVDATSRL